MVVQNNNIEIYQQHGSFGWQKNIDIVLETSAIDAHLKKVHVYLPEIRTLDFGVLKLSGVDLDQSILAFVSSFI